MFARSEPRLADNGSGRSCPNPAYLVVGGTKRSPDVGQPVGLQRRRDLHLSDVKNRYGYCNHGRTDRPARTNHAVTSP